MGFALLAVYMGVWTGGQAVGTAISRSLPAERSAFLMYLSAAVLGILLAIVSQTWVFEAQFLLISLVGGYQAWVGYFEIRAVRFSLTLTSLIFPLRFVLSAVLAAVFLGEAVLYKDPLMSGGAVLLLTAIGLFRLGQKQENKLSLVEETAQMRDRGTFGQWLLAIAIMIFLAGTAGFAMKYFASELTIHRFAFPSYWYPAAALFVSPVLFFKRDKNLVALTKQDLWVPLRGAGIIAQIVLEFWLYQILPLAIVAPALGFGTTVGPVAVGLLGFAERKEVSQLQFVALGVGFIGALLLVVARI